MPVTIYPTPASSSYPIDRRFKDPRYLESHDLDSSGYVYCKSDGTHRYDIRTSDFWNTIQSYREDDSFSTTATALTLKTLLNVTSGSGKFYGFISAKTISGYEGFGYLHYLNITIDGVLYTINLNVDGSARSLIGLNLTPGQPFISNTTTPYINGDGGYYDEGFTDDAIWTLNPSTRNNNNYLIYENSLKIEYYIGVIHADTTGPNCYVSYKAF